ncbi:hypothetical protein SAMN04488066_11431 [Halorubrum aquaticum]|uniref:Uncharacterized protein n=1 Tax=Halorubrum aquaticum TaxID=387340 RepID=A0A1I3BNZ6_9EURY|nr:hypothetical protein [Halorubrum aquaticum]SFH63992.1 hypothetical protein SAMN04488066_11431 [Halorubrum aquaticum]
MLLSALSESLERELTYPIESETVVDRMGTVRIEGPNGDGDQTIASILEPIGTTSFDSADGLFATIYGNLSDDHIGRKYYDDRGTQQEPRDDTSETEDVSF